MKRVLAMLLCFLLVAGSLLMVACDFEGSGDGGNSGNQSHVHTYKTDAEWSYDASSHWYDATCECADVTLNKLQHVDDNKDAICDVCKFVYDHEHTYAETWTVDCTNHWNAADCGCIIPGANVAEHVDENEDGVCDECAYIIEDLHEHYFDTAWTSDAENHWHAPLCEHISETADLAAHEINDAGDCTVCGAKVNEIDMTDILAVLKAAIANNYKIVTGDVTHGQIVYNGSESAGTLTELASGIDGVYFVLGNDQSYVFMKDYNAEGVVVGGEQQWFQRMSEDEIFGVKMDVNSYTLDRVAGVPAKLNGYNYMPGDLLSAGYDDTSTLAQTLYNMYDIMAKGTNVSDVVSGYDEESGMYAFAYTYYTVNETTTGGVVTDRVLFLYEVMATFSLNDDGIIDIANIVVKQYGFTNGGNTENDLVYDETTGVVSKGPNANPTYYIYEVFQTSGERTFTTPYPRASLIPVDFNFYHVTDHEFVTSTQWEIYDEELIGDSFTVNSGDYVYFHLGDPIPSTSTFNFIDTSDFTFTFVNNDPDSTAQAWYMTPGSTDALVNGYSPNIGCLKLKMRDPGTYTMTITLGDITKTVTLTILGEAEPEISGDADSIDVVITDLNTYENEEQSYTYTASAEGNYTFTVPAGLGVRIAGENVPKIDHYMDNGGTFTVGLNAGESVKLYFAAYDSTKRTVTVSFAAADIADPTPGEGDDDDEGGNAGGGTIASDISGTYYYGTSVLVIKNDGTMVLTEGDFTGNYTYSVSGTKVTYTLNGGLEYVGDGSGMSSYFGYLTFDSNGMPKTFIRNQIENTLTTTAGGGDVGGGDEGGDTPVVNTVALTIGNNSIAQNDVIFTYVPTADGTLTLSYPSWVMSQGSMSYTVNGGDAVAIVAGTPAVLTLKTGDQVAITVVANGDYATLNATWVEEGAAIVVLEGTRDNPYVLTVGESLTMNITEAFVADNYYAYVSLTVTESGWYGFNGYWGCAGDNDSLETSDGVYYYIEANTPTLFSKYVDAAAQIIVDVELAEMTNVATGVGDSVENAIAISGVGTYGIIADYTVSAGGVYVKFGATESGYYTFGFSNYSNTVTYNETVYSENSGNGALVLYVEAGVTYNLVLNNLGYDDNWNIVNESGAFFFDVIALTHLTVGTNSVVGSGEYSETVVITVATDGKYVVSIEELDANSLYLWSDVISINGYNPYGGSSTYSTTVTLEAGVAYTVVVYFPTDMENNPASGQWNITIAEAGDEPTATETALTIGNNNISASDVTYAYTASENGTLTLFYPSWVMSQGSMSYTVNGGSATAIVAGTPAVLTLAAGDKVVITVSANGDYATLNADWTANVSGGEEEPSVSELTIGNNKVEMTSATYAYNATAEGTLTLTAGAALMGNATFSYTVNDCNAVSLAPGASVSLSLMVGDKVVITVSADEDYTSLTAAWTAKPDGTEGNPYIVDTLPADLTVNYLGNGSVGMVWYKITVEIAGDFTITFDGTDNWFFINQGTTQVFQGGSAAQLSYSTSLAAGEYTVGIATWSEAAATLQVNFKLEVPSSGEGEGGVVSYIGANGSGRAMMVTIDAAAGTMSIIRAALAGNSLDVATGATEATYSYSFDGTTVTYSCITGQNCTCTFDENGAPVSIIWGSATYTGFAQQ